LFERYFGTKNPSPVVKAVLDISNEKGGLTALLPCMDEDLSIDARMPQNIG